MRRSVWSVPGKGRGLECEKVKEKRGFLLDVSDAERGGIGQVACSSWRVKEIDHRDSGVLLCFRASVLVGRNGSNAGMAGSARAWGQSIMRSVVQSPGSNG